MTAKGLPVHHDFLREIQCEYLRARRAHPPLNSAHEGYSVILEELDELWDEIKKKKEQRDKRRLMKEAIQVGAMALRFLIDLHAGDLDLLPSRRRR